MVLVNQGEKKNQRNRAFQHRLLLFSLQSLWKNESLSSISPLVSLSFFTFLFFPEQILFSRLRRTERNGSVSPDWKTSLTERRGWMRDADGELNRKTIIDVRGLRGEWFLFFNLLIFLVGGSAEENLIRSQKRRRAGETGMILYGMYVNYGYSSISTF